MLGTSFGSGGGSVGGSGHLARARPPLFLPLRAAASAALAAAAPVTVPLGPLPGFASPRVSVNVSVASLPFADLRWERVLLFSLWCKGCPNQGVCVIALKWLPGAPQERPFSLANYSPLLFFAAALVSLSLSPSKGGPRNASASSTTPRPTPATRTPPRPSSQQQQQPPPQQQKQKQRPQLPPPPLPLPLPLRRAPVAAVASWRQWWRPCPWPWRWTVPTGPQPRPSPSKGR